MDNQCPGDAGDGLVDELDESLAFLNPADRDELSWGGQVGATAYEVAHSGQRDFSTGCALAGSPTTFWVDPAVPAAGVVRYYLARAAVPGIGSWGADAADVERLFACP